MHFTMVEIETRNMERVQSYVGAVEMSAMTIAIRTCRTRCNGGWQYIYKTRCEEEEMKKRR